MATTAQRNGNTLYISASGSASTIDALSAKNISVIGIIVTAGAAAETLTLRDVTTTTLKAVFYAPATTTEYWDLSTCPISFPNGIRLTTTQTDSHATLIISEGRI